MSKLSEPTRWHVRRLIQAACVLTLVALTMMAVSILRPTVLPVVLAMSVGQGLGVLGLLCFIAAIVADAAGAPLEQAADVSDEAEEPAEDSG